MLKKINLSFILLFICTLGFSGAGVGGPPIALENRLTQCGTVLRDIMSAPDARIPTDLLRSSRGIIIMPSVIKAGIGVGGHYGTGVIVRRAPGLRKWGPPAFVKLIGGSVGWQFGLQSTDVVILIMNEVSLRSIFQDKVTVGVDASVAAGPVGRDASAGTDLGLSAGMLSYSRAKGIFAGVSIKGSVLEVDWASNEAYYGSDLSIIDIFFQGKGSLSPAARRLIRLLKFYGSSDKKP